jgi:tetratricopeptide (TPR) repeat protein
MKTIIKFGPLFLLIFVFTNITQEIHAKSNVKDYKDAKKAFWTFNPNRIQDAIEFYQVALVENPNDANAYAGLSESYSLLGFYNKEIHANYENEYNQAYSNILKALKLDNNNDNVKRALAYNYLYLSREKEAGVIAKELLAKNPEDSESMYILWSSMGQKVDNPNIYKSLRINPNLVIGYVELAKSYLYKKRKYGNAAIAIEDAIKIEDTAYLRDLLGTIFRTQRSLKKSIEQYDKSLKKDRNFAPAIKNLGISMYYKGNSDESISLLKRSIALNPTFPDAYFYLASNYQRKKNKDLARVNYVKFLNEASDRIRYTYLVKKAKLNLNELSSNK